METNLPTVAGFISTALFGLGTLPMLAKAFRTRDLASYSLGNILLSNVGNIIYSIYVFNLPPGPIWFLHSYYLLSTGLMLIWYLRYEGWPDYQRPTGNRITIPFWERVKIWKSLGNQRPAGNRVTARFSSPLCCSTAL